jgi:hypothetical protein
MIGVCAFVCWRWAYVVLSKKMPMGVFGVQNEIIYKYLKLYGYLAQIL